MEPVAARTWSWFAAIGGIVLVVAHLAVRATSGFGWVAVFQFLAVAPWLVLPIVPIALHVTRRSVFTDRLTRTLIIVGATAFAVSALTLDVDDVRPECFLGTCRASEGPDVWWESIPLVGASPFLSMGLSWIALCLLVAAMIRTRNLRRRAGEGTGPGTVVDPGAPPAPVRAASDQTQSVPGTPSGMAMVEPGPAASEAER